MMTVRKSARMTSAEYNAALEQLGLSRIEAARLLGVDDTASRRWANNHREVSGTAAHFLRYLIATGKTGDYAIKKLEG